MSSMTRHAQHNPTSLSITMILYGPHSSHDKITNNMWIHPKVQATYNIWPTTSATGHAKTQSLCELACVISQLDNMCKLSKFSVLKRSVPKKVVISVIFYVACLGMIRTICHSIVHSNPLSRQV